MSTDSDLAHQQPGPTEPTAATAAPAPPVGNPALLGLPTFLPGAITLGLWLIGYLDTATLAGGMIPAVTISAGVFEMVACVWAARIGQSAVAGIFGTFAAFWISFGVLLYGIVNGSFGLSADPAVLAGQVQHVQATYVLSWLIAFAVLTLATLRLPLAFTTGFALVVITFALVLGFVLSGSAALATAAGICVFAFCAVFTYIFFDAMGTELGGRPMPMGNPVVR